MADIPGTRDRLLEAAIEVIAQRGEAGLKVDEIAAMAEITKPSLYHFFGDREGLVVAAQAERFRRSLVFGLEDAVEAARTCTDRSAYEAVLVSGIDLFSSPEGRERRRVRLDVLGSAVSRPALKAEVDSIITQAAHELAELVEVGRERGWVNESVSSLSLAIWWYGTLLGRYLVETNDAFDVAEWDALMAKAVLNLVLG
jgi:AcrR family transcriptional regulator